MASPVRYPQGVGTSPKFGPLHNMPQPHPSLPAFVCSDDFDTYTAGHWTITAIGVATQALVADEPFGALALTNAAADNDGVQIQRTTENFTLAAGKKAWFETRLKVSDATQSDFVVGLCILDTTLLGAVDGDGFTDGIYFSKEDGDTNLDFAVQKDTTTGQNRAAAVATVGTSYMTLGFEYDGAGYVKYFVDGVHKGTLEASSTYLPDTPITVSFALLNGEAVAKVMTIDYFVAAIER
jgi:hypothetical protein